MRYEPDMHRASAPLLALALLLALAGACSGDMKDLCLKNCDKIDACAAEAGKKLGVDAPPDGSCRKQCEALGGARAADRDAVLACLEKPCDQYRDCVIQAAAATSK